MIRRITFNEAHTVIDLFDQYRVFYGHPSDRERAASFINARLQNNESVIFVAFSGEDMPVGFTQLYPKYSSARTVKNWILNDLYVVPGYREQGIGASLIKTAMAFAGDTKAEFLQLETAVDNYTAQRLYETIGFKKQAPDQEYFLYKIGVS